MMAKRFKFRIPSFQCCRSKDISDPPPPPPSKSLSRHVSSAFSAVGCGCRSISTNSDEDRTDQFHSEKEEAHSVTRCNDDVLASQYLAPPALPAAAKKKRRIKKKKTNLRLRISTSSTESGIFSSESFDEVDDEETETLVSSSKSISSDGGDDSSTEFNPQLETIREKPYKNKRRKKKRSIKKLKSPAAENESPARLSVFQRLIPCRVEGKVRESFAVVKKSEDPYSDFKRSMMEMIVEKEIFDEKDLEQLLHCLLSLNDREHHGVIVEAFSEIWKSLFSRTSTSRARVSF